MTLRRNQFSTVLVVLFTVLLAVGVAEPRRREGAVKRSVMTKPSSAHSTADWVFEGCWTRTSGGQCRDVFRDQDGNYWICRDCGTTGKPTPGKCTPISAGTLALGFWCS